MWDKFGEFDSWEEINRAPRHSWKREIWMQSGQ